jgi:hypothetical protein
VFVFLALSGVVWLLAFPIIGLCFETTPRRAESQRNR